MLIIIGIIMIAICAAWYFYVTRKSNIKSEDEHKNQKILNKFRRIPPNVVVAEKDLTDSEYSTNGETELDLTESNVDDWSYDETPRERHEKALNLLQNKSKLLEEENDRLKHEIAALELENENLKKQLKKNNSTMSAFNALQRDLERSQDDNEYLRKRIDELVASGRWEHKEE